MVEIPSELTAELKAIVVAELEKGNAVLTCWPRKGALCVMLKCRFFSRYAEEFPLVYSEDHDDRGPFAEYVHEPSGQSVLAVLY